MTIPAYPLQWPEGWKRSPPGSRKRAQFGVAKRESIGDYSYSSKRRISVAQAVERVRSELQRMGVRDDDLVISTNVRLRLDGLPRSDQGEPADPGVAVYWTERKGAMRCMAIDIYDRVADNVAAIAATLDAMRAIERHGGAEILNRAFTGFAALEHQPASWRDVLGVDQNASREEIEAAYKRLRSQHHPDRGGDPEQFHNVQRAYEEATAHG